MIDRNFRRSVEGFAIYSAIVGILLAALLAQTRVLAFGSFRTMVLIFLSTDLMLYISMKLGIIKLPAGRDKPNL